MAQRLKTDWILFATVVIMAAFGVLMLYSASSIMADLSPRYHSSWYFVLRQLAWGVVAVTAMMALKRMHYRNYQSPTVAFGAIGVALILLAAVYFVDAEHHRWLRIGPGGLQPSELAKPALVIFLAFFVTWRGRAINNPRYTLIPAALAVGLVIFAVETADLGTAVVLGLAAMSVFFVAGLEWRYCLIAAGIAVLGLGVSIAKEPYRLGRLVRHYDPKFEFVSKFDKAGRIKAWAEQSLRTRDTNYQQEQSEIAVGAGGVTGVGLMNGRQKLLYLPEAHTDFIFAIVGEEIGMIGSVAVLAGFVIILWRGLRAAFRIRDDFGRYLALGVTVIIVAQAFMNISVAVGMGPTKGIPLPLISYGGSSLFSTLALLGILMNVSEHAG
ncbi:MAG TPA: putative peptidoglycan glycosyltransferase FtsW [Bryobacteraceae bacterium]|jgi:cell division protein FtsW|nr:putative peptidoglycan glycosyltransferase FtsW [Bryobacteraceae bacterium]